jgi:GAF domain-containing protein
MGEPGNFSEAGTSQGGRSPDLDSPAVPSPAVPSAAHAAAVGRAEAGSVEDGRDWDQEHAAVEESVRALSALSSARFNLEEMLVQVAGIAMHAIPGADGVGLTLLESDRADLTVKSTEFVRQVDDMQYRIGEGPCISAAEAGVAVRSGSLGGDRRWPRFGPRAGRLGVHSVLSLPLIAPSGVVGALNVYAHARDAFDDRAEQLAETFVRPAAITVHNAHILAQTARLAAQLQTALSTRPVIDQAIGILRARSGISAAQAFDRLRHLSQTEHVKLAVVAEKLVEEAVRRARSRNT